MPVISLRAPEYRPGKDIELRWDNFRGGLNSLLRENEIGKDELARAYNLMLIGKGVPTKRWGTQTYFNFTSAATGSIRGLFSYYPQSGDPQLLAISDKGYLVKRDGASFASINGASWASGYNVEMEQLDNKVYIVSANDELKRYSNPTLVGFATIATPSSVAVTQLSGPSLGAEFYTYRVSALSDIGETVASSAVTIANQPQNISQGLIKVSWGNVTGNRGYVIYGRTPGDERFIGSVNKDVVEFRDNGSSIPDELTFPPITDTTGGFKAKYVLRWQDRMVYAGFPGEPSKVIITGRVPFHERFSLPYGNFIRIEPDAGDDVTGLALFGNRLVVFKKRSIWQVTLRELEVGNYVIYDPVAQLITKSHGCVSHRTIVPVENDIFFLSEKGVYALGYEPNIAIDTLRTNEISVKIRPFFEGLTASEKMNACAGYTKNLYIIAISGKDQIVAFDRERLAWMGPWSKDARVFETFFDASGTEVFLSGEDNRPVILDWNEDYQNDENTKIKTILHTRKEDFGDWSRFEYINDAFFNFKNTVGNVNVNVLIEDRAGDVTSKGFTISTEVQDGQSGWGTDLFGNTLFGDSEEDATVVDTADFVKWARINRTGRSMQVEITTGDESQSDYELLGIRADVRPRGRGTKGSGWLIE